MMSRALTLVAVIAAVVASFAAVVVDAETIFGQDATFATPCTPRSEGDKNSMMEIYSTQNMQIKDGKLKIEFNLFRNDMECSPANLLLIVVITTKDVKEVEDPSGKFNLVDVAIDQISVVPKMRMALMLLSTQCAQGGQYELEKPTVVDNACPELPFPNKSECPVYYFKMAVTPTEVEMTHFFKESPPGVRPKQYICDPDDRPDFADFSMKLARSADGSPILDAGVAIPDNLTDKQAKEEAAAEEEAAAKAKADSEGKSGGGGGGGGGGGAIGGAVGGVIVGLVALGAWYLWKKRAAEKSGGDSKKKAEKKSQPLGDSGRRTSTSKGFEDALVDSDDDVVSGDEDADDDNDVPEGSSSKKMRMTRSPSSFMSDV